MDKLLSYINSLSPSDREAFAAAIGTTINYLRKAISKGQKFDGALCINIEIESRGVVLVEHLRPDMRRQWSYIRDSKKLRKAA